MDKKRGSDPNGYNEKGKVTIDKTGDGWRTDIRIGTGDNHSHTVIVDGHMIYDRGVDPKGKSVTFVNSKIIHDSDAHGLSAVADLPDADPDKK